MPDRPDLNELLAKWQKILRLQDWDVDARYSRHYDMASGEVGRCSSNNTTKIAKIKVLDTCDYDQSWTWPEDPEQILVHELLHIPVNTFAPGLTGANNDLMEQMVESLAWALVKLDRSVKPE